MTVEDEHVFTGLRIPMNDQQLELDSQIQALAKTLVDSVRSVIFASFSIILWIIRAEPALLPLDSFTTCGIFSHKECQS